MRYLSWIQVKGTLSSILPEDDTDLLYLKDKGICVFWEGEAGAGSRKVLC